MQGLQSGPRALIVAIAATAAQVASIAWAMSLLF